MPQLDVLDAALTKFDEALARDDDTAAVAALREATVALGLPPPEELETFEAFDVFMSDPSLGPLRL